ncbi:MAG: D-aminoacyl-tRNA deacylase [Peptoniphilaceae bacterium]|nr:D-aminoacyl-tRNA deacylase [Peptoniphilaceae bacterium]MDD7383456.1 D-aminoacyl-tRNA deacylase [Peptoniphilaceae bacterium]MDY3738481.1 D-aminoacyl-tRNA deacylase [Peptoniphilaceae bacterium]
MRAIIQKVKSAKVEVENELISSIKEGFLVFVAVREEDERKDIEYIKKKIENIRIFEDENGKLNLALDKEKHQILLVSQFTLYADARKGNRPSFIKATTTSKAKDYYLTLAKEIENDGFNVKTGIFGADMKVFLINDGPVTIQLDSERLY